MDPVAGVAFVGAGVFAVSDWVARARDDRRLEYVCKPATLLALVVAAVALHPAAGAGARQHWFVAALVCSLAGDVFLMLPREQFVAGLSAFLVAHVCFVVGFWTRGPSLVAFVGALVAVAVAIGSLGARILPAVRVRDRALVAPVAAYMTVIGVMVATAVAVGNPLAAAGAVLFAASDSMIAWDRFVGGFAGASVWIMVTYHLGQAGLVASLLR
jgi:uncharacterized membrane protein YhhN